MKAKQATTIDGLTGLAIALPLPIDKQQSRYRAKLDTKSDIKKEMSRVYRETRSGLIDSQDATKQVWILQAISKEIDVEPATPPEDKRSIKELTDQQLMDIIQEYKAS